MDIGAVLCLARLDLWWQREGEGREYRPGVRGRMGQEAGGCEGRMVGEFEPKHFCLRQFSRPGIVTAGASDWLRASHMTKAIDQSDEFLLWRKSKGPRNAICLCVSERNLSVGPRKEDI